MCEKENDARAFKCCSCVCAHPVTVVGHATEELQRLADPMRAWEGGIMWESVSEEALFS